MLTFLGYCNWPRVLAFRSMYINMLQGFERYEGMSYLLDILYLKRRKQMEEHVWVWAERKWEGGSFQKKKSICVVDMHMKTRCSKVCTVP